MKKKVWEFRILDNPNQAIGGENDQFYTTDTEAFLVFDLVDESFNPIQAMLTLVNTSNKSVVNETVTVIGGKTMWEMREEIIEHAGNWQAQLVYMQVKNGVEEKYTSPVVSFNVTGHLLDQRTPALVAVENWTKFVNDAEELFAEWVALEETLELNENERIANEQARQENYSELVDTGIMQENINQKLADAEQEYAPRLTELEQNDENLTTQLAQNERYNIDGIDYKVKFAVVNGQPQLKYQEVK